MTNANLRRYRNLVAGIAACLGMSVGIAAAGPSIVVDIDTGRVISQENAFDRWYPASLTKLMTAYVAFRAVKAGEITLLSPVRVSRNAAKEPPSKMGFKPGSILTVDAAIKILMVKSANDVATAVAESVGGTVQAFAGRMNLEARRLGMTNSNFINAHGLHSDEQYTTARDLAVLALALRREFPEYASYFSIEAIGFGKTVMENHNTLIGRFDGADGMKTGYTCPSGFNLVASATRQGRHLLAVVIGEPSVEERAEKAAGLLARGFVAPGLANPSLQTMASPPGAARVPVNMRPQLCTEEAREARLAKRNAEGEIEVRSSFLSDPVRPPRITAVSLGGATGPEAPVPRYADVPIPTPRPDYTPPAVQGG